MVKDLHLRPWEKKPFWERQKYLWRHHFPMMTFWPTFFVITPILYYLQKKRINDPESKLHNYRRYKSHYYVLRDDDPEVEKMEDFGPRLPMYTTKLY